MRLRSYVSLILAGLILLTSGVTFAATEQLCTNLGSNCICGEPLNTATHDGGQTVWPTGQQVNPDDSPSTTGCVGLPAVEMYCSQTVFGPVAASTQAGFLPPGNTLSYVNTDQGSGICHLMHPSIVEAPDMTYCLRAYVRWPVGLPMPSTNAADQQQQKIMTIGALASGTTNDYLNIQIMFGEGPPVFKTRFDGNLFNAPVDFQDLGDLPTNCESNFCRLEACFDYSAIGEGRARFRRTSVAPGSGQATVFKPVGQILHPEGINLITAPGSGLAMFAQQYSVIRFNSYYIVTRVRPENRNFWPGPACEFEGGCGGSVAAPGTPGGLVVR